MGINYRLPFQLAFRKSGSTAGYQDAYNAYDYSIGGVPFLSGVSGDTPLIRKSSEFKKAQFDAAAEPGEQSLTGWWLRSQSSWHGGAGLKFLDPQIDNSAAIRFEDAEGVDVWTAGQVTLLRATAQVRSAPSAGQAMLIVGARAGSDDVVVYGQGTASGMLNAAGTNFNFTYDVAPTVPWQAITSDGAKVYLANGEGVWQAVLPGAAGVVNATKLWAWTSGTGVALGWVKGRLMAGVSGKLYELVPPVGAPPHSLPGTATYTSTIPGWTWTSITAGPEAIYVAGFAGNRGSILRVQVDNQGALPVLTGATEVAQLPTGEWPTVVRAYLGTFLAIGTNRGVRIAEISDGGAVQYGSLITTAQPVRDLVSRDKYVYAAHSGGFSNGNSGLLRVDLSLRHENGSYAYAKDLQVASTGVVWGAALIGQSDRIALGLDNTGLHFESSSDLVPEGYIRTARVRYNTLWPKLYKQLSLRGAIVGSLDIVSIDDQGTSVPLVNVGPNSDLDQDFAINTPDRPQEFIQLEFILHRDTATTGPILRGYQVKALPGGPRAHQFIVPLLCYDSEKDSSGVTIGYPGFAIERLEAIEALESAGEVVLFEDLANDRSILVTIEEIEFRQTAPQGYDGSQWGGILTVSLRTVS